MWFNWYFFRCWFQEKTLGLWPTVCRIFPHESRLRSRSQRTLRSIAAARYCTSAKQLKIGLGEMEEQTFDANGLALWYPPKTQKNTRWWFQRSFIFTPKIGEMIQFDDHIFQTGWFNHQLAHPFETTLKHTRVSQRIRIPIWNTLGFVGFTTWISSLKFHSFTEVWNQIQQKSYKNLTKNPQNHILLVEIPGSPDPNSLQICIPRPSMGLVYWPGFTLKN